MKRLVVILMVLSIAGTLFAEGKPYGEETGKDWNSWSKRSKQWFIKGYLACMGTCMARLTDKGLEAGMEDDEIVDRLIERYNGYFDSVNIHIYEIDNYYARSENVNDEILRVIPYIWNCHWWDVEERW